MRKSLPLLALALAVTLLSVGCKNKPPNIPSKPVGPDSVAVDESADYKSFATDPNKDDIRYIWSWGDGYDTTELKTSGDTVTLSHAWSANGTYGVKVKAQDEKDNYSVDWSDSLIVVVGTGGPGMNHPPDQPSKPVVTGDTLVGATLTVQSQAVDPDGDSVAIKFYLDDGNVPFYTRFYGSGQPISQTVIYGTPGAKVIRAQAKDYRGDTSAWSASETVYITAPNTAPRNPEMIRLYNPHRGIADGPTYRFYARATDLQGDDVRLIIEIVGVKTETTAWVPSTQEAAISWRPTGGPALYTLKCKAFDREGLMSEESAPDTFRIVTEGEILWSVPGEFIASPALTSAPFHGQSYPAVDITGAEGYLYMVDMYQSEFKTVIHGGTEVDDFRASPAIGADGTIYAGNDNGVMYALNPDGTQKWAYGLTDSGLSIVVTATIDGNYLYYADEGNKLRKLADNGASASQEWEYTLADDANSSPLIRPDGKIVIADDSGYVHCVDASGNFQWKRQTDASGIVSSPAVGPDNKVYLGTGGGVFYCIGENGDSLWAIRADSADDISSSPAIDADGYIYFGANNGRVYKVDPAGNIVTRWEVASSVPVYDITTSPALCGDGRIYIAAENDYLYALNPDGTIAWSLYLQPLALRGPSGRMRSFSIDIAPSPAVGEYGIIYVATGGYVFAVAGRSASMLATSAWPMFHHDVKHTGRYGARR